MQLEGMRSIYASEVAYVPGGGAPRALETKAMMNCSSPSEADQILAVARQLVPDAELVGPTSEFRVDWNPNTYILTPGPDEIYAIADTSGGRYMYGTADGYRPIRIQSVSKQLDQFVAELVASYDGQQGIQLVKTPQGIKLQWVTT